MGTDPNALDKNISVNLIRNRPREQTAHWADTRMKGGGLFAKIHGQLCSHEIIIVMTGTFLHEVIIFNIGFF